MQTTEKVQLEGFVHPKTHAPLSLNETGDALSDGNGNNFPVNGNIPSFVGDENFGDHWDNATDELPESKIEEARDFLKPLIEYQRDENRTLNCLDAGCGDGVHLVYLKGNKAFSQTNSVCAGIDISHQAVNITNERIKGAYPLAHGDCGALPYADSSFDSTFSYGVLAYTDVPADSFKEMVRVTKKGGMIGVWIYPKQSGLGGLAFGLIRQFCKMTGSFGTNLVANCIVPFLGFLPTKSKLSLSNGTWEQCKEVVMVNIAPTQLFFPTQEEIEAWFEANNIEMTHIDHQNQITIWGKKK